MGRVAEGELELDLDISLTEYMYRPGVFSCRAGMSIAGVFLSHSGRSRGVLLFCRSPQRSGSRRAFHVSCEYFCRADAHHPMWRVQYAERFALWNKVSKSDAISLAEIVCIIRRGILDI